jgi:hypothetical protein
MLVTGIVAHFVSDGCRSQKYFHIAQIYQAWSTLIAEMYIIDLALYHEQMYRVELINKFLSKNNAHEIWTSYGEEQRYIN